MQKEWIEPKLELPAQGKKILAFSKGDVSVRQRFGKHWIPIPYVDSIHANLDEPQLWKDIELPGEFTGLMLIKLGDVKYELDEFEKACPVEYNALIDTIVEYFNETRKVKKEND